MNSSDRSCRVLAAAADQQGTGSQRQQAQAGGGFRHGGGECDRIAVASAVGTECRAAVEAVKTIGTQAQGTCRVLRGGQGSFHKIGLRGSRVIEGDPELLVCRDLIGRVECHRKHGGGVGLESRSEVLRVNR